MATTLTSIIGAAGVGNPWDLADELLGGDSAVIMSAAGAYDEAASHAADTMATVLHADPQTAMSYSVNGAAVHDADAASRATRNALGDGGEHFAVISRMLRTVAADLDTAKTGATTSLRALEAELRSLDERRLADQVFFDAAVSSVRNHGQAVRSHVDDFEQTVSQAVNTLAALGIAPFEDPDAVEAEQTRRRQADLFQRVTGRAPVTAQDWRVAETLDPSSGGSIPPANVIVARITPIPGAGLVYGSAFIKGAEVMGFPFWESDLGDNRGADPSAAPGNSRVSFVVDYENGIVVVRQNPSHSTDGSAETGIPTVGVEQDSGNRVRLRVEAANPLAPGAVTSAGWEVRADLVVDPSGGANGTPSINGTVSQYPSWEAYQERPGSPPSQVLTHDQVLGAAPVGPAFGLPLDGARVGERPDELDEWRRAHHSGQYWWAATTDFLGTVAVPMEANPDPFFDYAVDPVPASEPDGSGGIRIPDATRVGP